MKQVTFNSRGFTLVELLVVITIITILAGLTLATVRFATIKGATEKTRGEIFAMVAALESYKADNGDYPKDATTNAIDARNKPDVLTTTGSSACMSASVTLYKALSGDVGSIPRQYGAVDPVTGVKQTVYMPFKANMLSPKFAPGTTPPAVTALVDPFKNVYGYSTIGGDVGTAGSALNPDATNGQTKGYNPTYDLWSTVDADRAGATPIDAWMSNFKGR